jgi:hypothetical protein
MLPREKVDVFVLELFDLWLDKLSGSRRFELKAMKVIFKQKDIGSKREDI